MGFPNTGEPFSTNVSIVISVGPILSISGVGFIANSDSSNVPFSPNITATIAIDAITAPMAKEGG